MFIEDELHSHVQVMIWEVQRDQSVISTEILNNNSNQSWKWNRKDDKVFLLFST